MTNTKPAAAVSATTAQAALALRPSKKPSENAPAIPTAKAPPNTRSEARVPASADA